MLRVTADGTRRRTRSTPKGVTRGTWTYGHRNVQGLAHRTDGVDQMWSVEHGPSRDDEINRIIGGTNYGWSPTPGYNESRAMTDTKRYPKAKTARWRSGSPTVAPSGATFLNGSQWGDWNGHLGRWPAQGSGHPAVPGDRHRDGAQSDRRDRHSPTAACAPCSKVRTEPCTSPPRTATASTVCTASPLPEATRASGPRGRLRGRPGSSSPCRCTTRKPQPGGRVGGGGSGRGGRGEAQPDRGPNGPLDDPRSLRASGRPTRSLPSTRAPRKPSAQPA